MSSTKSFAYIFAAVHALALLITVSCKNHESSFTWNDDGTPVYTWQTTIRSERVRSTLTGYGWSLYESYVIDADGEYGDLYQGHALPLAFFFFSADSVAVFTTAGNDTICTKQEYSYHQEHNKLLFGNGQAVTLKNLEKNGWWAIETLDTLSDQTIYVISSYTIMIQESLDSLKEQFPSMYPFHYE